jgi:hypothetical protein
MGLELIPCEDCHRQYDMESSELGECDHCCAIICGRCRFEVVTIDCSEHLRAHKGIQTHSSQSSFITSAYDVLTTLACDVKYNGRHHFHFKSVYNQRLVRSPLHTFRELRWVVSQSVSETNGSG